MIVAYHEDKTSEQSKYWYPEAIQITNNVIRTLEGGVPTIYRHKSSNYDISIYAHEIYNNRWIIEKIWHRNVYKPLPEFSIETIKGVWKGVYWEDDPSIPPPLETGKPASGDCALKIPIERLLKIARDTKVFFEQNISRIHGV